jgi:hypothetical protein
MSHSSKLKISVALLDHVEIGWEATVALQNSFKLRQGGQDLVN